MERQKQLSQVLDVEYPIFFDGDPKRQAQETGVGGELKMRMLLENRPMRSLFGVVHELLGGKESGVLRQ